MAVDPSNSSNLEQLALKGLNFKNFLAAMPLDPIWDIGCSNSFRPHPNNPPC